MPRKEGAWVAEADRESWEGKCQYPAGGGVMYRGDPAVASNGDMAS
jgi:hypothetical protein